MSCIAGGSYPRTSTSVDIRNAVRESPTYLLQAFFHLPQSTPSWTSLAIFAASCALTAWHFASQVSEESILIIKDFGIQLRILYKSGSEETKVVAQFHKLIDTIMNLTYCGLHLVSGQGQNYRGNCSRGNCWIENSI